MAASLVDLLPRLADFLAREGFDGSAYDYRSATDRVVAVINFQPSDTSDWFYVNVGVQPLFIPTEAEAPADPATITEPQCVFRKRVDPSPSESWGWYYSTSTPDRLEPLLLGTLNGFVRPLMRIPGPLNEATVADFEQQPIHPVYGLRDGLNFLHWSRIATALGDPARGKEFAEAGLALCNRRTTLLIEPLQTASQAADDCA
ncbi:MAG: DUF4304 domain-containing protein [Planctomycetota bacterium]